MGHIFNWLGDEVANGRARSPNAAKTEALGAFAQIADWMEGAKYEAQLPDGQLKLAVYWPIASGGRLNWMALVEHGGKCTRQDGSERTLRIAKAAAKAAALKLLPGS